MAGFGKGEAKVTLSPEGPLTRLDYSAKASVGGKLAQIGSRLVDSAARKLAEEFFTKFTAELASRHPTAEAASHPELATVCESQDRVEPGTPSSSWWRRLVD
ncbi:Carbon monoxide dehydrogenase subunit G (CoxG) [compost metagenome]